MFKKKQINDTQAIDKTQTNIEKNVIENDQTIKVEKKKKVKISRETKKKIKVKKEKEPKNIKLAIKEFPTKMVKEINKIKWPKSNVLKNKYVIAILFMITFAVFFFIIDLIVNYLFGVMHAI